MNTLGGDPGTLEGPGHGPGTERRNGPQVTVGPHSRACNASQSVFPSLVSRYHLLPRAQA